MMKKLLGVSMLVSVLAALGFVAFSPVNASEDSKMKGHMNRMNCPMKGHRARKAKKGCSGMQKMMKHHGHGEHFKKCRSRADALLEDLKAARKAIKQDRTKEASKKLDKVIGQMERCQKMMMKHSSKAMGKPVNTRCPITGKKVDPEDIQGNRTRKYQGKTVGFCCQGCPQQWDNLSDEEKAKKLQEAKQEE